MIRATGVVHRMVEWRLLNFGKIAFTFATRNLLFHSIFTKKEVTEANIVQNGDTQIL